MQSSPNISLTPDLKKASRFTSRTAKSGKKTIAFFFEKRQKFVISVIFLSLGLFLSEYQFGKSGFYLSVILSLIADLCLFWAVRKDLDEENNRAIYILPFLYSLSFSLFYFLIPARLLFRLTLTILYAFGMYSLFLSQNIFIVSKIRTIQLLSGARIVSFVITLVSYFFLSTIVYSLHIFVLFEAIFVAIYSYLLIYHALWTYTMQKNLHQLLWWAIGLTICLTEIAVALWFWPSSPIIIAIFLSGMFYICAGLSQVWFEKRLFRNVLWEYVWMCAVVFFVLILFTKWGK